MASQNVWGQPAQVGITPSNEWGQQKNVSTSEPRYSWGAARKTQQENKDGPQTGQGNGISTEDAKWPCGVQRKTPQPVVTNNKSSFPNPLNSQNTRGYNAPQPAPVQGHKVSQQTQGYRAPPTEGFKASQQTQGYRAPPTEGYNASQQTQGYRASATEGYKVPQRDYTNGNASAIREVNRQSSQTVTSYNNTNENIQDTASKSENDSKYSWGAPKRIQDFSINPREEVSASKSTSADYSNNEGSQDLLDYNHGNTASARVTSSGDATYDINQQNSSVTAPSWGKGATSSPALWSTIANNTAPVSNLWGNSDSVITTETQFDRNTKQPTSPLSPAHPPVDPDALEKLISTQLQVDDNQFVSFPDGQGGDNLRSCMLWQEFSISRDLMRGLAAMDFRQPSGIQARALPEMLTLRNHTLVQSQNGTGKTATYLITILSVIDCTQNHCQALVMVHTHELALQVAEVARNMGKYLSGFRVAVAIPGTEDNVVSGPVTAQLVVGTPGTLWRWAAVKSAEKINPFQLKIFTMDEADQLMETEAFNDTLRLLKKKLSSECQLLFFSATFEEDVRIHARNLVGANKELKEILLSVHELALQNVRQFKMYCSSFEEKLFALFSIYRIQMISGCLVFCKTRDEAHKLADAMRAKDHLVGVLTGKMTPQEREREIERFRNSETRALISTNVCSRGLDIDHINLVVNWDLPILPRDPNNPTLKPDFDTYLHRVGRSGRFGRYGLAINFVANEIDNKILEAFEKYFTIHIPGIDYLNVDDLERIKNPRSKDD